MNSPSFGCSFNHVKLITFIDLQAAILCSTSRRHLIEFVRLHFKQFLGGTVGNKCSFFSLFQLFLMINSWYKNFYFLWRCWRREIKTLNRPKRHIYEHMRAILPSTTRGRADLANKQQNAPKDKNRPIN